MPDRPWKRAEREVAKRLGGKRVPVSGRGRGSAPDVDHARYSIEVKLRRGLPRWLHMAMQQAEAAATDGKVPAVVLHEAGKRYDDAVVVLRLANFTTLAGTVPTPARAPA
jgi:hypothetical protein